MTLCQHCHLWAIYWTADAALARQEHNTEHLMLAEQRRALALRCERCSV